MQGRVLSLRLGLVQWSCFRIFNSSLRPGGDGMSKRSLVSGLLLTMVAMGIEIAGAQKSLGVGSLTAPITRSDLAKTFLPEIQDIEERMDTIAEGLPVKPYNSNSNT